MSIRISHPTGPRPLVNAKNNFERGREDVFSIKSADVGELQRIRIYHDNTGASAGWSYA